MNDDRQGFWVWACVGFLVFLSLWLIAVGWCA
jgi:hypothetical protein